MRRRTTGAGIEEALPSGGVRLGSDRQIFARYADRRRIRLVGSIGPFARERGAEGAKDVTTIIGFTR